MACADILGVLLAAGAGQRFGGNKLEAMLEGTMLGLHAARTLQSITAPGWRIAVHDPAHIALALALTGQGYALVANDRIHEGLSHSLRLALDAAVKIDAAAVLICLGDMPRISAGHLDRLVAAHLANPGRIIASVAIGVRSPPAILPRAAWPRVRAMTGDRGARTLLTDAICVEVAASALIDIDHVGDLERLF